MPILEVHLVDGDHDPALHARLLEAMSLRYAEVLESPLERIRAYVTLHDRSHWAVGGRTGGEPAPYFTAIVLEQRHRLLAEFTDLLVDVLGVARGRVRGRIIQVPPDDWAIGGVPAAAARRGEIAARATT